MSSLKATKDIEWLKESVKKVESQFQNTINLKNSESSFKIREWSATLLKLNENVNKFTLSLKGKSRWKVWRLLELGCQSANSVAMALWSQ